MKKIIIYGLLLIGLVACKKSKNEPDQRPDDRLTAALSGYQTQLTGAKNGWIAYLFPKGGGSYTFKFKFDDKNRVNTYSDIDATKAATPKESSYRLRATQLPSLYFDTYTYLHLLADPDETVAGGIRGSGKSSDFEFSFLSSSADTIRLKGNLNGSDLIMVRAKDTEGDDYVVRAFNNNLNIAKIANFQYYYNKLTVGGKDYNMTINADNHTISFYYNQGGFKRFTTEYGVTATGIQLRLPFIDGSTNISELHDFNINLTAGTADLYSGNTKLALLNVDQPLVIETAAPTRMYTAKYKFSSDLGFTMSGVRNAQNVKGIPNYQRMEFNVNYGFSGLDALIFYYGTASPASTYGPAYSTQLTSDGKFIFYNYVGNFGTSPGTAGAAIVTAVRTQLLNTGGYYAFQTDLNSYDLVSVTNSKNWIRFR